MRSITRGMKYKEVIFNQMVWGLKNVRNSFADYRRRATHISSQNWAMGVSQISHFGIGSFPLWKPICKK